MVNYVTIILPYGTLHDDLVKSPIVDPTCCVLQIQSSVSIDSPHDISNTSSF